MPNLPREALDLDNIDDREYLREVLCDAKPAMLPGTQLAYHAVSGGFILGEVVHRVTGKDIRTVLAEEFLDPLGFRWTNYGVDPADVDDGGASTTSPDRARRRRCRRCSAARSAPASTISSRRPTTPAT